MGRHQINNISCLSYTEKKVFDIDLHSNLNIIVSSNVQVAESLKSCLSALVTGLRGDKIVGSGATDTYGAMVSIPGCNTPEAVGIIPTLPYSTFTSATSLSYDAYTSYTFGKSITSTLSGSQDLLDFIKYTPKDELYKRFVYIPSLMGKAQLGESRVISNINPEDMDIFSIFNELSSGDFEIRCPGNSTNFGLYCKRTPENVLLELTDTEFDAWCVLSAISEAHLSDSVLIVADSFTNGFNPLEQSCINFYKALNEYCVQEDIQLILITTDRRFAVSKQLKPYLITVFEHKNISSFI